MDKFSSGNEDLTSSASDDETNSSFLSPVDDDVEGQELTSDEETENVGESVSHPMQNYTTGNRTTIFKFKAEAVVNDLPEHKDLAAKHRLTYKQGSSSCRLIANLFRGHGFRETDQDGVDYNVCWMGSHVKPQFLASMQSFQRVNHFPRSFEITRKDRLYKNIEKMQQAKGFKNFDFVPQTFILPIEYNVFYAKCHKEKCTWIVKPAALSRGRGIFLTNNPDQCPSGDKAVACKYITNPLLIDGLKFDIRLYVAVTSFDPLVIYLYEEGLTRFATVPFDKSIRAINNTCMHLTNYSVNKRSTTFVGNKNSEVENQGSKWTLGALLRYLKDEGHDTTALMLSIEDVIIKTMIAGEAPISSACKSFVNFKSNCFELFGFDILLDENFKPWVLEVNLSPSLACDAPLDLKVKSNMVSDLFNLIGVECQDPVTRKNFANLAVNKMKTTKVGRLWWRKKICLHQRVFRNREASSINNINQESTMSPLLTNEEQRMLSKVKDEFERRGNWVRIFPTETSWNTYRELFLSLTMNNIILNRELFAESRKNRKNMEKSGHVVGYLNKEEYQYSLADERCKQYERCLSVLSPSSSTVSLKRISPRNIPDKSSQDASPIPVDEPRASKKKNSTETRGRSAMQAAVVQSREERYAVEKRRDIDLRKVLLEHGFTLSYLQARRVFFAYLRQLSNHFTSQLSDDTDALLHFLRNAGNKLCREFAFAEPQAWLTAKERRSFVDLQLQKFLELFHKDSLSLEKQQQAQDSKKDLDDYLDNDVLDSFIDKASKSELEVIFNLYTEQELNHGALTNQKPLTNAGSAHGESERKCRGKGGQLLGFSEALLAKQPKWARFGRPSGGLPSGVGPRGASAMEVRTFTPTLSSSFLSAFSVYGGVNPLGLRPFSSMLDKLSNRVDPNLIKTFNRLRIRVKSARSDPSSHPLDDDYKRAGPSVKLSEANCTKPFRNLYAIHTKKDLSNSKKGSQPLRLPSEIKSETIQRTVSDKTLGNSASTKSRVREEILVPSILESNNFTSGRRKIGGNEKLVFSSSGVFRVNEMGDCISDEKVTRSRRISTTSADERKESKPADSKKKTLKDDKHSIVCLESSDPSQDEECEVARGQNDESEVHDTLRNLSLDRSPYWEAVSVDRSPKCTKPKRPQMWR